MLESEVKQILDSVVAVLKKERFSSLQEKKHEYYQGYDLFNKWRDSIRVHSESDIFPHSLLLNRSPNTTEDEWNYIKSNYKQTTGPVAVDYLQTVNRAWTPNNWAIDYNEQDEFQAYVQEGTVETPLRMSVENYFKTVFPYVKMIDSMGCIVVKPHKIPTAINEDGQVVMSGTELTEPIPVYYSVQQLVAVNEDLYFMFEMKERSLVEYGGRHVREGRIYEFYENENIWRITQVGKKIDFQFTIEVYFNHAGGSIPVSRCKGVPVVHQDQIVWQSRFLSVVGLLDEVILDSVYLRGVKNISAFPYRVMTGNICTNKMEINGEIQNCDGSGWFINFNDNQKIKCSECGGSGMLDRVSPYGQMLLRPETRDSEGEMKTSQPAMYYVSPPIDTPQFLRDEIEKNFKRARSILHLLDSSTEVKGSEDMTATQVVMDMKALYAFVEGDSTQTFGTYEWALSWIGFMRDGKDPTFVLSPPRSFDFYTDYDYLFQVSEAIKNGLPPFLVASTIMKYIKSLWSNDMNATKVYELMMNADRLLTMTDDELVIKQSRGLVADWEIILHDSGVNFIKELLDDNPKFFDQELSVQKEQLETKAKEKATETQPTTEEDIINASIREVNPDEEQ